MKIYRNIIQGTDEWHDLRHLKLTASHATAIGNAGKGLDTYITDLVLRTFIEKDHVVTRDIERGNLLEPIARLKYEFEKNVKVEEVGFIERCENSGFSPDGLVEIDYLNDGPGLIEIKARNDAKHYALLKTGKVESGVIWQMQMAMLISGRKWCDFISYNPNFKKNSLFIKRFYVDEEKHKKLEFGLKKGIEMLKKELSSPVIKAELAA